VNTAADAGVDFGSLFTASTLTGFSAADVRVRAKMTSLTRVDKALVLRARDPGNRIELNFRATYVFDNQTSGADLVIQELVDCVYKRHVLQVSSLYRAAELQTIAVEVELRGQQFKITADGKVVYTRYTTGLNRRRERRFCGDILLEEMFDDFVVETLK